MNPFSYWQFSPALDPACSLLSFIQNISPSSSHSFTSSFFSTSGSTESEEPLDLSVGRRRRELDSFDSENAFTLCHHLYSTNQLYGGLIEQFRRDLGVHESSSGQPVERGQEARSENLDVGTKEESVKRRCDGGRSEEGGRRGKESLGGAGGPGGGGKAPLIFYHPEEPGSREIVRDMLRNKHPDLQYVNDGDAIVNPFAVDRKQQLAHLTAMFCRENAGGGFTCGACGREKEALRSMQQHLLCHSDSKFYLCVRCLKGFNDTFDMKRHTRKHTLVRPYACSHCPSRFSQRCSLEGHLRKVHRMQLQFARRQRREVLRVCERCGYVCSTYAKLLSHTEREHPTDRDALLRMRKRIASAGTAAGSGDLQPRFHQKDTA